MEVMGFEPTTFSTPRRRSPIELHPQSVAPSFISFCWVPCRLTVSATSQTRCSLFVAPLTPHYFVARFLPTLNNRYGRRSLNPPNRFCLLSCPYFVWRSSSFYFSKASLCSYISRPIEA